MSFSSDCWYIIWLILLLYCACQLSWRWRSLWNLATTAGTVLSLMQLTGIVAGVGFASLTHVFKRTCSWSCFGFGLALALVAYPGSCGPGFRNSLSRLPGTGSPVSSIAYQESDQSSRPWASLVLINNLRISVSSFFIQLVTPLAPPITWLFVWIGGTMVGTGYFSALLAQDKPVKYFRF